VRDRHRQDQTASTRLGGHHDLISLFNAGRTKRDRGNVPEKLGLPISQPVGRRLAKAERDQDRTQNKTRSASLIGSIMPRRVAMRIVSTMPPNTPDRQSHEP